MIGEARATPAAGSASGEAIPAEPHLQPQPAESPPKVESGIGRYSFGRRLGSLWPASTPTPVPNSPPAKGAAQLHRSRSDRHMGRGCLDSSDFEMGRAMCGIQRRAR